MRLFGKIFGHATDATANQVWQPDAATRADWDTLYKDEIGFRIYYPEDWFIVNRENSIDIIPDDNPTVQPV